jgi:hypothetical protein
MLMEFGYDSGMEGRKSDLAKILDAAQELRETKVQMRASGFLSAADVAFLQKPFELPENFDRDFFHVALHGAHVENEPLTLNKDWFAKQPKEFRSGFWRAYCRGGATAAALYLGADPIDMDAINERLRLAQEKRAAKKFDLTYPAIVDGSGEVILEPHRSSSRYVTPHGEFWIDFQSRGWSELRLRGLESWNCTVVVLGRNDEILHCSSARSRAIASSSAKKMGNRCGGWDVKALICYPLIIKREALCS